MAKSKDYMRKYREKIKHINESISLFGKKQKKSRRELRVNAYKWQADKPRWIHRNA